MLIADPEEDIRAMVKAYAASEGFLIDEAPDGITALKFLPAQQL